MGDDQRSNAESVSTLNSSFIVRKVNRLQSKLLVNKQEKTSSSMYKHSAVDDQTIKESIGH